MTLIADVFPEFHTLKEVVRQISKKSSFRRPLDMQHGKQAKTLFEYQRQHFSHIY